MAYSSTHKHTQKDSLHYDVYWLVYVYVVVCMDYNILLASERDTYRANTIENRGCLFIGERAKRARQY